MKTLADLMMAAQWYVQYNGDAPTLEEINKEDRELDEQFPDSLGCYEFEPFSQELVDEAVQGGFIVCDAERRIYLLSEVYRSVASEKLRLELSSLTYKEHIRKQLNNGFAWRNGRLTHSIYEKESH